MPNPISVMIVDDHDVVRVGLRGYLETQPDLKVIAEAKSGEEAVILSNEHKPDVILMDLVMSGMDGIESTKIIKDSHPKIQVIILTSYHDDRYIFPALQAGAISYLLKDVKTEELADAIRKAVRGEPTLHPLVASRVIQQVRGDISKNTNPFTELTDREMEVMQLIARGYTNNQIANKLVISIGTVKGHVSNILSKLHLSDRTQVAVYAWQQGIIRREDKE
jgi:NarL family two-component system response regulator LiaR